MKMKKGENMEEIVEIYIVTSRQDNDGYAVFEGIFLDKQLAQINYRRNVRDLLRKRFGDKTEIILLPHGEFELINADVFYEELEEENGFAVYLQKYRVKNNACKVKQKERQ
jgi:hypothetical protein